MDHLNDFLVISDSSQLKALADEGRLAMITLLSEGRPLTGAMVAEKLGLPANRAQYHLLQLLDCGLIREVKRGRKRWKEERFFVASARHFIVDPRLACSEPGVADLLLRNMETAFSDWRRREVLGVDIMAIARKVVHDTLRVQPEERVLVMFGPDGMTLSEAIAVELSAVGAKPLLRFWSRKTLFMTLDRHDERSLERLPFLSPEDDAELDAGVFISSTMPQGDPPTQEQMAKLPLVLETVTRWQHSLFERRIRYVEFALPQRGEFDESVISPEEAITIYWRYLTFDSQGLEERGRHLLERIEGGGQTLHLTGRRGTDLRIDLDIDRSHVSDGIVSAADVAGGRSFEELPAGTVVFLPASDSASGIFTSDYTMVGGNRIYGIKIGVKNGLITDIDAKKGAEILKRTLDSAHGDGRRLATIRFGINPAGEATTGKFSLDMLREGCVTLTFGNNELFGGDVYSTIDLVLPAMGVTATLGTNRLIDNGRLINPSSGEERNA